MKISFDCISFWLSLAGLAVVLPAAGADLVKADNKDNLDLGSSWVSGIAPGATDNAVWNSTVATADNCKAFLANPVAWNSIVIKNPAGDVAVNGNTTLTLADGVNMSNATVDLTVDCDTITLSSNQNWNVPSGRTLITGSAYTHGRLQNNTITKTGGGLWVTSGTDDNGSLGVMVNGGTVNLNKSSTAGTHAIGGPGLTINSGSTVQITGTGGDQIYDYAPVTLAAGGVLDLNGNNESIMMLSGNGGTVDTTSKSATLTLGSSTSTFGGSLQNSGVGAKLSLVKSGTGTFTLAGPNTYNGGTTVTAGTLALSTTNNVPMPYTNTGGTLSVKLAGSSLQMTSLTLGSGSPQLTFNLAGARKVTAPIVNDSGSLAMVSDVTVNVMNLTQSGTYVLLQYSGTRTGSGRFVAGSLPLGATLTDDTANNQVVLAYDSPSHPGVIIPTLNPNEIVVAIATPQQYGAKGDGVTDDTAAFQNAMNAVYNSGGSGGGVVFVPAGTYAFYNTLSIPTGVTLHGDWMDWTRGSNGLVGTTFKVFYGAGQTNGTPFIFLNGSTALRDVNFWYPNQDPADITPYPFTIGVYGDCVVQNVVLVNSYQGIQVTPATSGAKHILSTVIGSPLYKGIDLDAIYDISHAEDIRFSPDVWPASHLPGAPEPGGPHAAWMRANGTGMRMLRVDGELCMDTFISGYAVGIQTDSGSTGEPGVTFYSGSISNCATAVLAQQMPSALGLMFTLVTLDGDIAVNRTATNRPANVLFDRCQITGRSGTAVNSSGSDWHSWMQFQNCTISNTLVLNNGVFNLVNCTLLGATQCVINAQATDAAFTGCSFSPTTNIVSHTSPARLLIDSRQPISSPMPVIAWTDIVADYQSRQPAKTNLYVVTDAPCYAAGDGATDDTAAIQSALDTAGAQGGGIVYAPAGKYRLTDTLDVPTGVELRGAYELRHRTWPGPDGHAKGTVLQPYAGQDATNGPAAIALEANSGLVGVTITYEAQNGNCNPYPPAIQGRGPNVYAIGVVSPNPYIYVDLDTYTCTNHFFYMIDGWALKTGFHVGNGSSGSIVDCQGNWTYWIDNYDSQSQLNSTMQTPVSSFAYHNAQMYILGDCTELLVKDFNIVEKTFMLFTDEGGKGPNATLIGDYCDATIQGMVFDAAALCSIDAVNTPMCVMNANSYSDLTTKTVGVLSTTNFQGTARMFSTVLFASPYWDFDINGGNVTLELFHMDDHSYFGSRVNGGVLHLVNNSAYKASSGSPTDYPAYNVAFGSNAGIPGKVSEFIGCYTYNGCTFSNPNTNNPVNVWADFALNKFSTLALPQQFEEFHPTPPPLAIQLASTPNKPATVQWPAGFGTFSLYHTTNLTTWTQLESIPVFSNNFWTVSVSANKNRCEFFHLQ